MAKLTKKEQAYKLFSQGYKPRDPEVKKLGLHPQNRYRYFYDWNSDGCPDTPPSGTVKAPSDPSSQSKAGESIGSITEERANKVDKPKVSSKAQEESEDELPAEEPIEEDVIADSTEEGLEDEIEPEAESTPEEPEPGKTKTDESVGAVSEVIEKKSKDGEKEPRDKKIATTVADDGIKCTTFLSLETLALYRIAATTQAQLSEDGDEELTLGDFLDTCVKDFYAVRGKKLGLIISGGKK